MLPDLITTLKAALRLVRPTVQALFHTLASARLAVCLIVTLATVIAVATVAETKHGRHYSQWFVYHSGWFIALLALLGLCLLCAALSRWPWRRHHTGFVVTHAGLLVLLAGSMMSLIYGMEGQMVLLEGASSDQIMLSNRNQVTAWWAERPHDQPYVFTFEGGPVDWKANTTLDVGCVDDVRLRVCNYYQSAEPSQRWVPDTSQTSGPLVRFELQSSSAAHTDPSTGPDGTPIAGMLVDQDYGGEVLVGPLAIRLQRSRSAAMLADFMNPPPVEIGKKGVLTIYYQEHVQRADVAQNIGQPIAVGNSGAQVELVQYFGDAKLDATGKFQPLGETSRNPLVEMKVTLPGETEPYRQVAFAKSPLLNFDGVYERECPIKFTYQHPEAKAMTAVELLQAEDGQLVGRIVANGEIHSQGELTKGSRLMLPGGFVFTITEYVPHARSEVSFESKRLRQGGRPSSGSPAAEFEFEVRGKSQRLWLQRSSRDFQSGEVETPHGSLKVHFTPAECPLDFSVQLIDFQRDTNPGQIGNAAYSSVVRVLDEANRVDRKYTISMNQPLKYRGWRFYQSSFREAGHDKEASILNVARDPGRLVKYLGSGMVCLGIAIMFYMRAYFFRKASAVISSAKEQPAFVPAAA